MAVVAVAAFFLLSGPKWDDPVDNWVLDQEVKEGDYIEYEDRFTVVSVSGNTCEVKRTGFSGESVMSMSKQDFLRLLSAPVQMKYFFEGFSYNISMHLDEEEHTYYGTVKNFDGHVDTNKFGLNRSYDMDMNIGDHNILYSWSIDTDYDEYYTLDTNLSFVRY